MYLQATLLGTHINFIVTLLTTAAINTVKNITLINTSTAEASYYR